MPQIGGDALRGHLETMILSVLERGESHGFEVWRRLEAEGQGSLRLKEGSLYPALYRLEKAGLVKAEWEKKADQPSGDDSPRHSAPRRSSPRRSAPRRGGRRRIYCITPKGKRQLGEGRHEWQHFVSIIGPIVGAPA